MGRGSICSTEVDDLLFLFVFFFVSTARMRNMREDAELMRFFEVIKCVVVAHLQCPVSIHARARESHQP